MAKAKAETKTQAQIVEVPQGVDVSQEQYVKMLVGLRDLNHELWGYKFGRIQKREKMNEETEEERKAVRDQSKTIKESIPQWIQDSDIEAFKKANKELDDLKEEKAKAQKPYKDKFLKPLRRGIKHMENVVIPDALAELGKPVQPRFKLSQWVEDQLEEQD